ncbi:ribonuclease domain-containing protein [Atopococcus tabaci]|uniref:ribonuclease domain-containing protein n=1 Tax=Atopococcus tabaci TaxID=269774 RepID=UPI0004206355|nr:ribonuclease domain-containing protein [Atopococcus tabaci]
MKKRLWPLLLMMLGFLLSACGPLEAVLEEVAQMETTTVDEETLDEDGYYSSPEDVALYLYTFETLPDNYITKAEARDFGWEASEGNLWEVTDQLIIGGDRFGNREGLLPEAPGRQYYEADVNYNGGYRGEERLVYSNDGLIYYTDDHYDSFTLLYGEE